MRNNQIRRQRDTETIRGKAKKSMKKMEESIYPTMREAVNYDLEEEKKYNTENVNIRPRKSRDADGRTTTKKHRRRK